MIATCNEARLTANERSSVVMFSFFKCYWLVNKLKHRVDQYSKKRT